MTQITSTDALGSFNALGDAQAERELRACCGARRWASAVAAGRPYPQVDRLLRASDAAFATLTDSDLAEALASHPRIGERVTGSGREATWSRREQSGTAESPDGVMQALAEGNAAYEQRFDRVFLICASGLSAEQMLAELHSRLGNDEETERAVVREELRKITRLRLEELVS